MVKCSLTFSGAFIAFAAFTIVSPEAAPLAPYGAYSHVGVHNQGCSTTSIGPGAFPLDSNATCGFAGTNPTPLAYPNSGTPATSAFVSVGGADPSGNGYAIANLSSGHVEAYVQSIAPAPFGSAPLQASAVAGIWETVRFHGAAPGATGTIRIAGTVIYTGDVVGSADFLFQQGLLDSAYFLPSTIVNCTSCSGTVNYERSKTFNILNDTDYTLVILVRAFVANHNEAGSLYIDDPISFELPIGVSFTTQSGTTFAPALPEPTTLAAMGLGLIGIGLARRRKSVA